MVDSRLAVFSNCKQMEWNGPEERRDEQKRSAQRTGAQTRLYHFLQVELYLSPGSDLVERGYRLSFR